MTDNHFYTIQEQTITTALMLGVVFLTMCLLLVTNRIQEKIGE